MTYRFCGMDVFRALELRGRRAVHGCYTFRGIAIGLAELGGVGVEWKRSAFSPIVGS